MLELRLRHLAGNIGEYASLFFNVLYKMTVEQRQESDCKVYFRVECLNDKKKMQAERKTKNSFPQYNISLSYAI
jgi:hypothetical protein